MLITIKWYLDNISLEDAMAILSNIFPITLTDIAVGKEHYIIREYEVITIKDVPDDALFWLLIALDGSCKVEVINPGGVIVIAKIWA